MAGVQVVAGLLAAVLLGPSPRTPTVADRVGSVRGALESRKTLKAPVTLERPTLGAPEMEHLVVVGGLGTLELGILSSYPPVWQNGPIILTTGNPFVLPRLSLPPPQTRFGGYSNPAARFVPPKRLEGQARDESEGSGPMREVISTGSATVRDGDRQAARQAAIQQALRNALEKVVGVYVSAATVAQNYATLTDRVYTRAEGYAVPGDVLEEGIEQGTATVRMRVMVSLRPLLNRLKELGLARAWRVAVAIRDAGDTRVRGAGRVTSAEIVQRLIAGGFQVVSPPDGAGEDTDALLRALRGADGSPLADLLVVGTSGAWLAERLPVTLGNETIGSVPVFQGRVDARAVRVETGEVVAGHVVDDLVSDPMDAVAASLAVESVSRTAAARFVDDILALPGSHLRRVQLEVRGFGKRGRAQEFEDALPLVPGVARVQRLDYANGRLLVDLEVDSAAAERLGTELERASPMNGFGVTVESDTKARICARVAG